MGAVHSYKQPPVAHLASSSPYPCESDSLNRTDVMHVYHEVKRQGERGREGQRSCEG